MRIQINEMRIQRKQLSLKAIIMYEKLVLSLNLIYERNWHIDIITQAEGDFQSQFCCYF